MERLEFVPVYVWLHLFYFYLKRKNNMAKGIMQHFEKHSYKFKFSCHIFNW